MDHNAPADQSCEGTLPGVFPETRWTLVMRASEQGGSATAAQALDDLCRAYWRPVYAVARSTGLSHEDAEDITQNFFADLITTNSMNRVTQGAGRLRWFILGSLRHQMGHWREKSLAAKRGGGRNTWSLDMTGADQFYYLIPADHLTPEVLYDRHWMMALTDRAMGALAAEQAQRGRGEFFAAIRSVLTADGTDLPYSEIAKLHGLTEAAVKMAVMRLRTRLREMLRAEIAETVAASQDVDDEIRQLFAAFR